MDWTTWDREVATVNQFYIWAASPKRRLVEENPILQRENRAPEHHRRGRSTTPAEASHQGAAKDVKWLTPRMYRMWRDVGLRGYTPEGLPDPSFRGRFASRNATYADLMIRTGLRLCEQTSLSVFEVPSEVPGTLNARTWIPHVIAKYLSLIHICV